jgi:hypothetical protein
MSTYDFSDPILHLAGFGDVDCRNSDEFHSAIYGLYWNKSDIIDHAWEAASTDFALGVRSWNNANKTKNPHNKLLSIMKWTCWQAGYCGFMKYYCCSES